MQPSQKFLSLSFLALLVVGCVLLVAAHSQVPTARSVFTEQQALQTILSEVQQTRQTVQRSMTLIYRAQTLLNETRLHYEQINRLQKDLDQLRADGVQAQSETQRQTERLRDVGTRIEQEKDAQQLATLRAEENEIRLLLQETAQNETLRQEREMQTTNELRTERAKLAELQRQLATLEQELSIAK